MSGDPGSRFGMSSSFPGAFFGASADSGAGGPAYSAGPIVPDEPESMLLLDSDTLPDPILSLDLDAAVQIGFNPTPMAGQQHLQQQQQQQQQQHQQPTTPRHRHPTVGFGAPAAAAAGGGGAAAAAPRTPAGAGAGGRVQPAQASLWFSHGHATAREQMPALTDVAVQSMFCAVYAAGGGKKRMANFVRGADGKYGQSSIYVRLHQKHLTDPHATFEIIRKTSADEWESKPVPEWTRDGPTAATVKLEPQWFKTKFWNNKQEKKNPWFAFRLTSGGVLHVTVPFPVYQYYPHTTDPNSPEYHAKAVAPLLEQGLPLMCASLDRALSAGQIFPSSAEKKTGKRKSAGAKSSAAKSAAAAVAARDRARSASPKAAPGSPVAPRHRTNSGSFKAPRHRRTNSGAGAHAKKAVKAEAMSRSLPFDMGALLGDASHHGPPRGGMHTDAARQQATALSHGTHRFHTMSHSPSDGGGGGGGGGGAGGSSRLGPYGRSGSLGARPARPKSGGGGTFSPLSDARLSWSSSSAGSAAAAAAAAAAAGAGGQQPRSGSFSAASVTTGFAVSPGSAGAAHAHAHAHAAQQGMQAAAARRRAASGGSFHVGSAPSNLFPFGGPGSGGGGGGGAGGAAAVGGGPPLHSHLDLMSSVDACLQSEAEMFCGPGMMEFDMGAADVGQGGMLLSPHSDGGANDGWGSAPSSPTLPPHLQGAGAGGSGGGLPAAVGPGGGMMDFSVQQPTRSGDPSVESLRRQMDTSLTHNSF